ncbi:inner membrane protein OXA1L [Coprinopsis sp. MPI-PUGE-AT-0042]|nr:inner membrane protein OXA1L [Coprinopsis sp. MPI-PUGE-AT-0042]
MLAVRVGLRLRCTPRASIAPISKLSRPAYSTLLSTRLNGAQRLSQPAAALYARRNYTTEQPPPETAALQPSGQEGLVEAISDPLTLTDTIVHQIPPLAYGDFTALGLSSWSPIGIITWSYEILQVSTGLPWFWTIVAGSALWRLVCVPLAMANIRSSARLKPYQPAVLAARERMSKAQGSRDAIELQKASAEMKSIYRQADVNPVTGMILPMVLQLPIQIGTFFALRRVCEAGLQQLTDSGVSIHMNVPWAGDVAWLQDLTVADPTYILPAVFCAVVNTQIIVGSKEMDTSTPSQGHLMNVFRALSFVGAGFMSQFPAGLFVGLITTSGLTVAQSLAMRAPALRRMVGIPQIDPKAQGKLPSFMDSIKYLQKMIADKQIEAEKAARASKFQQGGVKRPGQPGSRL